ncbi:hypothetical protein MLD38_031197 [Melastoma candidum]|uniref:Uncharacterized protein n=1 Tax=Melastoma candidum TaxID=119954 RepID=A0ACB9MQ53_9MYRT|nr:hypothetical protein MLD38_031197 [Melastoma candidum]
MERTPTPTPSTEATVDTSNPIVSTTAGGGDSSCHDNGDAETSAVMAPPTAEGSEEVESAELLMEKGSRALKEGITSRPPNTSGLSWGNGELLAVEFGYDAKVVVFVGSQAARYGELALGCVNSYYKYGCALLSKDQEEADLLGAVPKKEGEGRASDKEGAKENLNSESSVASVSNNVGGNRSFLNEDGAVEDGSGEDEPEEDDKESDAEDLAEADEDEPDLDLAWKMLDIARAVLDKHSVETEEKVKVLSALAEVALEREDIETSLSDYKNALSILEKLVEPDGRLIAELICLCPEIGLKPEEAIPFCEKAI